MAYLIFPSPNCLMLNIKFQRDHRFFKEFFLPRIFNKYSKCVKIELHFGIKQAEVNVKCFSEQMIKRHMFYYREVIKEYAMTISLFLQKIEVNHYIHEKCQLQISGASAFC